MKKLFISSGLIVPFALLMVMFILGLNSALSNSNAKLQTIRQEAVERGYGTFDENNDFKWKKQ